MHAFHPGEGGTHHNGVMAHNPETSPSQRTAPKGWVIILGLLLSAMLATINWLQLASLERGLEGVSVPETQVFGYSIEYVDSVRVLMTDELLERYGAAHYLWGPLFAAVFATTLILLARKIAAGRKIRWLYIAIPALYAIADITENLVLEALFASGTATSQAVAFAATLTVLKGILFVLALVTALLTLITRPRT